MKPQKLIVAMNGIEVALFPLRVGEYFHSTR